MKNDLATAIVASIIGIIAAFFVTNLFFGDIEDFSISIVDDKLSIDLADPDENIFNYLAINPTVEVYVGECDNYDETTGECLDKNKTIEDIQSDSTDSDMERESEPNDDTTNNNAEPSEEETEEDF